MTTTKSNSKYEYTQLGKADLTSADTWNFYGVIVDATFPYKVGPDRYICSLKVADPTINSKSKQDHAQVVLYAKKFVDLPIIHRIGDVIRVNRANLRMYNGAKQFNANIYYKSSWALFSTDKLTPLGLPAANGPFSFSGGKFSFDKKSEECLNALKKWASTFLAQNNVGESKVTLKAANKQQKQFDVCAKVLQVNDLDDYTNELKLRDGSGDVFYTLSLKVKFPHLRQGSAVRIRSAQFDDQSNQKKMLVLQHYSNIMTFTSTSKLGTTLNKVADDKSAEKAALKSGNSMLRIVLTEVDKKHQGLPVTSLREMFNSGSTNSTFRTSFYVSKVEPSNLADSCQFYDKKTKKFSSATSGKGDLVHRMQFLAKDVSTQFDNNVYRILLYSHEGLGSNFLGKAVNLHKDTAALKKLTEQVSQLTRFNSWVDAVVERRNGFYFLKDTRFVF